jgi:hypothetical protein
MRRKRLQHIADTMCQMFCGWRLIGSKPNLVDLGSGTLEIDAITGECFFQGGIIKQLTIAEEIRVWMQDDLAANKIPFVALKRARLSVNLSFSVVPWSKQNREIFYSDTRAVRTEKMNRCTMECDSNVATDEAAYCSKLTEVQEWPIGWPANNVLKS